ASAPPPLGTRVAATATARPARGSLAEPAGAAPAGRLVPAAGASFLVVDRQALAAFRAAGGGRPELPGAGSRTLALGLEPYPLLAGDGAISTTDGSGRRVFTPDVSLYRGQVAGESDSWAVIAMGGAGVFGTIERAGRRWSIGPLSRTAAGSAT